MATVKITKKHHKHLNNPFPSAAKSLPFIQGNLFFNSQTFPAQQVFHIGKDFQLTWSSINGGSLSISPKSYPSRAIWSTVCGMAFLSAALAETEVEESRGSFVIKDRDVRFVSNHQTIEDIRVIEQTDTEILSGIIGVNQKTGVTDGQYPFLLVTGSIFSVKQKRNEQLQVNEHSKFLTEEPSASATYSLLFDQKRNNQIGFEVKFGEPIFGSHSSSKLYRRKRKLVRIRRFKLGWCWASLRRGGFSTVSSSEDEGKEEKSVESVRFNRVCFTYSSERSERFYGFGEQFSRMDFKGKRVPIIVQEQGIGRGDQPISLAINLVSYR